MADDSDGLKEVPASEILAKIQNDESVEYNNAIITGDIDVTKLNLPRENKNFIIYSTIEIKNSRIQGIFIFNNVVFEEQVAFVGTYFSGNTSFTEAQFANFTDFTGSHFSGNADFNSAQFDESAIFNDAQFNGVTDFREAQFNGYAYFCKSQFSGWADFRDAQFNKTAVFREAQFNAITDLEAQFNGEVLTFKGAKFKDQSFQEYACRRAKNLLEKNGDRVEAGYHFYREMEAKRRQKPWYYRYPEYGFIQVIFGYGVHPFRLMFCWFVIATVFAIFYSVNGGIISKLPASSLPPTLSYFVECFYFSIVTAVTPGYGKYELTSWVYQVVASVEAIFGTFMWAAFIATFARKFMR